MHNVRYYKIDSFITSIVNCFIEKVIMRKFTAMLVNNNNFLLKS